MHGFDGFNISVRQLHIYSNWTRGLLDRRQTPCVARIPPSLATWKGPDVCWVRPEQVQRSISKAPVALQQSLTAVHQGRVVLLLPLTTPEWGCLDDSTTLLQLVILPSSNPCSGSAEAPCAAFAAESVVCVQRGLTACLILRRPLAADTLSDGRCFSSLTAKSAPRSALSWHAGRSCAARQHYRAGYQFRVTKGPS